VNEFWAEVFAQSDQVREANARRQRARDAAEQARVDEIVEAAYQALSPPTSTPLFRHGPHKFEEYGNTGINSGCVRCPYGRDHPVHAEA